MYGTGIQLKTVSYPHTIHLTWCAGGSGSVWLVVYCNWSERKCELGMGSVEQSLVGQI
jgi:hypothetical protein